jgi:3-methyladenine DNA glycosylase AlkD
VLTSTSFTINQHNFRWNRDNYPCQYGNKRKKRNPIFLQLWENGCEENFLMEVFFIELFNLMIEIFQHVIQRVQGMQ